MKQYNENILMKLRIYLTTMGYRIPIEKGTILKGYNIDMKDYYAPFIEDYFDNKIKRFLFTNAYRFYDEQSELLYIPIFDLPRLTKFLDSHNVNYELIELPTTKGLDVDIPLQDWFKPNSKLQEEAVDHIVNNDNCVRGLSLQTGMGKTASVILASHQLKKRMMVTLTSIGEQWRSSFLKFTKLDDNDVYMIKGLDSIFYLLEHIDKTIFPKVIIASIPTLQLYSNNVDVEKFNNLCNDLNVGIRVIDEVHLRFKSNLVMDLRLNPQITIPVTATFKRSSTTADNLFQQHYPVDLRFGEDIYNKYVKIIEVNYPLNAYKFPRGGFTGFKGYYSHAKFEGWILSKRNKQTKTYIFNNVHLRVLNEIYFNIKNKGEKLLVFFDTINMCKEFTDFLRKVKPDYVINCCVGSMNVDDITETSDVIISTPGKCGTGVDIKNLRSVYMTIAIASSGENLQNLGRLRVLDNDITPVFAYNYCRNIEKQQSYADIRKDLFKSKSKEFRTFKI